MEYAFPRVALAVVVVVVVDSWEEVVEENEIEEEKYMYKI